MALMAQPFKHPQTGVYYFRREVPRPSAASLVAVSGRSRCGQRTSPKLVSASLPRRLPVPPPDDPVWPALVHAFSNHWLELPQLAYEREHGNWWVSFDFSL